MPRASKVAIDRIAIPSAQDACGMEIRMEENEGKEKSRKNAAEALACRFSGHFSGGTCRMYGTGDLGGSFFSVS